MRILDTADHESFLAARKGKIGSSDIGAICGLNPYRSPLRVFLELTGKVEPDPENAAMRRGKLMEPIVVAEYQANHPDAQLEAPCQTYEHDCGWGIATPDRFLLSNDRLIKDAILECKTSGYRMITLWGKGIPDYVQTQVQWQLGICGMDRAVVAALVGGSEWFEKDVLYNKEVFEQLFELGERFMERVKKDDPPPPIAEDLDLVKKLQQPEEGTTVELNYMANDIAKRLMTTRKTLSSFEKEKKELETWLRLAMGTASKGIGATMQVRIKSIHKKAYPVAEQNYTQIDLEDLDDGQKTAVNGHAK